MRKFTVVIPTRERVDTLQFALQTILRQDYENLEIIVSDNASTDGTADAVRALGDRRVRYVNTGRRVSMSHNFEFALSHVTDGWVTFVGDDDGLLPGAIAAVDAAIDASGCKALTSAWCIYRWPGASAVHAAGTSHLSVPMSSGLEIRDSRAWLQKLLAYDATYIELPFIYTGGFASMELIDLARDSSGRFFRSRIPDVYSAIAIAAVTERYAVLHTPVAIAGISSHSTGRSLMTPGAEKAPGRTFEAEANLPFHPSLGDGYQSSIPLMIYESYLQSAELHRAGLSIAMADQLALILSVTAGEAVVPLTDYIAGLATMHGLDLRTLQAHAEMLAKRRAWQKYSRTLRHTFLERRVETTSGGANVLEASVAAKVIQETSVATRSWRFEQGKQLAVAKYKRWRQAR